MPPSTTDPAESFVYFNRGKMLFLCIGCFVFVGLAPVALLITDKSGISGLIFRIVWITADLLFFGAGFLWTLRALFKPKYPALIITDKGITDNASAFSAGFIPFEAMQSIIVGPVVTISINDPKANLCHLSPIRRWFQSTNVACFGGVMFSTATLNTNIGELEALIKVHYERWSETSSNV